MTFPTLRIGSTGQAVRLWQHFLNGQKIPLDPESRALDGIFGGGTLGGTKKYQSQKGLPPIGVVDAKTLDKALQNGFDETAHV